MFKKIKKKGYVGLEIIILAGVVIFAAGLSVPVFYHNLEDDAQQLVDIKNKVIDTTADPETGYIVSGGQSIHLNGTEYVPIVPEGPSVIDPGDGIVHVNSVTTNVNEVNLLIGESVTVTATITPSNAANKEIAWVTSNRNIATVSANGRITAVGSGVAEIRAVSMDTGIASVIRVVVSEITSTGLVVDPVAITMREGQKVMIKAQVVPANTTNQEIVFTSENTDIVTVSQTGEVTAKTAVPDNNKTNIVVSNGSIKKYIPVEVIADRVYTEEVLVDTDVVNMYIGDIKNVNATVSPSNATNKTLRYEVVDETVASVDANGNIQGLKKGSTALYIYNNGADFYGREVYAVIYVNVESTDIPVEAIDLEYTNNHMDIGDAQNAKLTITPDDATNKNVTFVSSNPSAVTVDTNGKVYAVAEGVATITATCEENPNITDTYTIIVNPAVVRVQKLEAEPSLLTINVGETGNVNVTVFPDDATNKTLNWVVGNEGIATVDKNSGDVYGVAAGTTEIRIESQDNPDIFTVVTVLVKDTPINSVTLSPETTTINKGDSVQFTVKFDPEIVSNSTIFWSVEDGNIGTIDDNGLFIGLNYGVTRVVAEASNGVKGYATVNVSEILPERITLNKSDYEIILGECVDFDVTVSPENTLNKSYNLVIANGNIATVDTDTMKICGHSIGETTMTATTVKDIDVTTSANIRVIPQLIEKIVIDPTEITLDYDIKETYQIQYKVLPTNSDSSIVTFESSDPTVAVVSDDGFIQSTGVGETIIYVNVNGLNNITDTLPYEFKVTVTSDAVAPYDLISDEGDPVNLRLGQTPYQLKYHFLPDDATLTNLDWHSVDEAVAIVDANGVVTPVGVGDCEITATTTQLDGEQLSITFNIKVEPKITESIEVTPSTMTLSKKQNTGSYEIKILPLDGPQGYNVSYDEELVTVDKVNQKIIAKGIIGETTVYFYDEDYRISDTIVVTIVADPWAGESDGSNLQIKDGVCEVRLESELAYLADQSRTNPLSNTCQSVQIMNDLNFTGYLFKPFGTVDVPVEGDGYVLKGLTIEDTVSAKTAFINNLTGELQNVTFENLKVTGKETSAIANTFSGTLNNIDLQGATLSATGNANLLVSKATGGIISNVMVSGNTVTSTNERLIGELGGTHLTHLYIEQNNMDSVIGTLSNSSGSMEYIGFTSKKDSSSIVGAANGNKISVKNSYFVNPDDYTVMSNPSNVHFGKDNTSGTTNSATTKYDASGTVVTTDFPAYTVHKGTEMKNSQTFVDLINEKDDTEDVEWYLQANKYPNLVVFADRVVAVKLNNNKISIPVQVTKTYSPEYSVIPSKYSIDGYTCKGNSDDTIATVSSSCEINTLKVGQTIFTVDFGNGLTQNVTLNVVERTYPSSIKFLEDEVEIVADELKELEYVYEPADANYVDITFETSDPSVAIVTGDGTVVGVKSGAATVTILATAEDGTKLTDTIIVNVFGVFNIEYELDGGELTGTYPLTYTALDEVVLPTPKKLGYTFTGWTGSNGDTPETSVILPKGTTGNKSYTAHWVVNNYTVKYNGAGSTSGTMADSVFTYDVEYTLPANTYQRTGYTFLKWNTNIDGYGTSYANKATVKNMAPSGTLNLFVIWAPNSYTINYDGNGATSGATASSSHVYDVEKALTTNGFSRTGYTFNGWNTKADGSGTSFANKATVKNVASSGTTTLYAQWKANTYTVKYDGNGATGGSTASSTHQFDKAQALTANGFTKTGYGFVSWNTKADGTGTTYTDKESVKNLVSTTGGSITLYAQWDNSSYTVKYDGNGATGGSTASSTHTYDVAKTLTANGYTRTGYTFNGWNTKADGSGTAYADKASVKNLAAGGTFTLYAQWNINSYALKIDPNGGYRASDNSTAVITVNKNYKATESISERKKTGYTLVGYDMKNSSNGSTTDLGGATLTFDSTSKTGTFTQGSVPITLVAKWEAIKYTTQFDPNGGYRVSDTNYNVVSYDYTYGQTDNISERARAGYTLTGYIIKNTANGSTTDIGGATVTFNSSTKTGQFKQGSVNVTVVAQWSANTNTATFNPNGGSTPSPSTITKKTDEVLGTLPTTSRSGYTFNGWYTAASGGTKISTTTKMPTSNVTYYAQWSPVTYDYNIVYKSSSGVQLGTGTVSKAYGTTNSISPKAFTGYTSPAAQSVTWDTTSAKTITFTYEPITYTITYTLNSGSATNKTSYTIETDSFTLNNPTRTGYTFAGWTGTGLSSASTSVTIAKGSTGNKSYTANWNGIQYTVVFNGNGSTSGSMSNQTHTYGSSKALTANAFGRAFTVTYNYNGSGASNTTATATSTFNGWATSASGSKVYDDKATVSNLRNTAGDYNLYAKWTNGKVTLPTPTRTGYTFTGWNTKSDGSGATAGLGGASYTPTANTTLYAQWKINSYTATFNANGGSTPSPSTITKNYGSTLGTLPTTSRTGYTFKGWYTAASGGSEISTSTTVTGNVTYYAQWNVNSYTVTQYHYYYHEANASWVQFNTTSDTKTYGSTFTPYNVTAPSGYSANNLYGYYTSGYGSTLGENKRVGTDAFTVTQNIIVHVHYNANTYTVSYNCNGATGGCPATTSFKFDSGAKISSSTPTKNGYTFTHWSYGGTSFSPGQAIPTGWGSFTLTANWRAWVTQYRCKYWGSWTDKSTEDKATAKTIGYIPDRFVNSMTKASNTSSKQYQNIAVYGRMRSTSQGCYSSWKKMVWGYDPDLKKNVWTPGTATSGNNMTSSSCTFSGFWNLGQMDYGGKRYNSTAVWGYLKTTWQERVPGGWSSWSTTDCTSGYAARETQIVK